MAIRPRSRYKYVNDNGDEYLITLADDIGTKAGLGFVVADGTETPMPTGFKPRYVQMMDPVTGRSFKRVVGTLAAAAWATPLVGSYAWDDWGDADDTVTVITARIGERQEYGSRPVPA